MRYSYHWHLKQHRENPTRHLHHRLVALALILALIAVFAVLSHLHALNYGSFYSGFAISLTRVVIAYFISVIIGVVLALLATRNQAFENILIPIFDVAQSFPSLALIPLLVSVFGHNGIAVVIILLTVMIWPITLNIIGYLKTERQDLSEAASIYGAKGTKKLLYFTLPALLPPLLNGSIVAWGEAWDSLVGAEIISSVRGVGTYLGSVSGSHEPSTLFLAIALYLLIIFVLNEIIWMPLLRYSVRYQSE